MSPSIPPKFDFQQDLDMTLSVGDVSGIRRANSDGSRHKRGVKSEDLSSLRGPNTYLISAELWCTLCSFYGLCFLSSSDNTVLGLLCPLEEIIEL